MRVLVDTSTWSPALSRHSKVDERSVRVLAELISTEESLFLTGLILQEILQAHRSKVESRRVERYLQTVPLLHLDRSGYVEAAGIHARCAGNGFSASTADCQIAAAAIRFDCKLLTADRDFERIAEVSELQLL